MRLSESAFEERVVEFLNDFSCAESITAGSWFMKLVVLHILVFELVIPGEGWPRNVEKFNEMEPMVASAG